MALFSFIYFKYDHNSSYLDVNATFESPCDFPVQKTKVEKKNLYFVQKNLSKKSRKRVREKEDL